MPGAATFATLAGTEVVAVVEAAAGAEVVAGAVALALVPTAAAVVVELLLAPQPARPAASIAAASTAEIRARGAPTRRVPGMTLIRSSSGK